MQKTKNNIMFLSPILRHGQFQGRIKFMYTIRKQIMKE